MNKTKPDVHDILGTVEGLHGYSRSLRDAAIGPVHDIKDVGTGVLVDPAALVEISNWLSEAANELHGLVPDGPLVGFSGKQRVRTLVRIINYCPDSGAVTAVLPGWNPEVVIKIKAVSSALNEHLGQLHFDGLAPTEDDPLRINAWVNIQAASAEELEFSDWEAPQ